MASYLVTVDLQQLGGVITSAIFPRIRAAVGAVAQVGAEEWHDKVMRAKLWIGEKEPYAKSITWRYLSDDSLSAVIETSYPLAEEIETGRPQKDLKRMLDTSPKAKLTKDGRRYLTIPFRHNISTLQRAGVYDDAKGLRESTVKNRTMIASRIGYHDIKTKSPWLVPKHHYKWGDRMESDNPQLNGLYRFKTSAGRGKSSAYLTFRTMVEGSPGWIIAPRPGLLIAKEVADGLVGDLNFAIGEAVAASI